MGLTPIRELVLRRKLLYFHRLLKMDSTEWAAHALRECKQGIWKVVRDPILPEVRLKGEWTSSYLKEINKLSDECDIEWNKVEKLQLRKGRGYIISKIKEFMSRVVFGKIGEQRLHSLRSYPQYLDCMGKQAYLDIPGSQTLAQFRLGDAGLGNRDTPTVEM